MGNDNESKLEHSSMEVAEVHVPLQEAHLRNDNDQAMCPESGQGQEDCLQNHVVWPQVNRRRWDLVIKKHQGGGLTDDEAQELAHLQEEAKKHNDACELTHSGNELYQQYRRTLNV